MQGANLQMPPLRPTALISPCLFLVFGLHLPQEASAQLSEKQYLNEVLEATSKKNAAYYRIAVGVKDGQFLAKTFSMDGGLKTEGSYADPEMLVEHGRFIFYHRNGKVESRGEYVMGLKTGVWERFDQWGRPLAEKVYDPEPLANIVYTRAQTMPRYPLGGERELVRYIKERVSPVDTKHTKGSATASFIVEKDGQLSDVRVIEQKGVKLDHQLVEAIRSSAPWEPGMERGQPVRVQMKLPVQF